MNKALALLVALAAGAQANVCNSGCDWNALAANAEAPTATCGGRITWLQNNRAMSAAEACLTVAGEFPSICGSCAPQTPSPTPRLRGTPTPRLADRGIPLVYVGTGAFGGYGYLDKIFATSEWTTIDARDRGTGGSDHPAISAELRL